MHRPADCSSKLLPRPLPSTPRNCVVLKIMPAHEPGKIRRSRITAACAICRAKRQKCSGEKPICIQCRQSNEECAWSDSKKRGPAKDYLRSLQDRLQETERLLLGALSRLDDADLTDILTSQDGKAPSYQTWSTSLSGQAYWQRIPLSRLDSIRQWQRERRAWAHGDQAVSIQQPTTLAGPDRNSDGMVTDTTAFRQDQGAYTQDMQGSEPNIGPTWSVDQSSHLKPHERDVAEALYSISNSHSSAFQQQQLSTPSALQMDGPAVDHDGLPGQGQLLE